LKGNRKKIKKEESKNKMEEWKDIKKEEWKNKMEDWKEESRGWRGAGERETRREGDKERGEIRIKDK